MQHGDIWRGIDLLARKHGLSASGLARRAGLDATAFNKSKRIPKDGRPRWPSTESLSRVLEAVGEDMNEFSALVTGRRQTTLPLVQQDALQRPDMLARLDDRSGAEARQMTLPGDAAAANCFVIEITHDTFAPVYAPGDRLVVSPNAPLRMGHRVIAKLRGADVVVGVVHVVAGEDPEIRSFALAPEPTRHGVSNVDWIMRILWVSQ
jgi:phage repressor protein C with HTH and peptisase S24 domain